MQFDMIVIIQILYANLWIFRIINICKKKPKCTSKETKDCDWMRRGTYARLSATKQVHVHRDYANCLAYFMHMEMNGVGDPSRAIWTTVRACASSDCLPLKNVVARSIHVQCERDSQSGTTSWLERSGRSLLTLWQTSISGNTSFLSSFYLQNGSLSK